MHPHYSFTCTHAVIVGCSELQTVYQIRLLFFKEVGCVYLTPSRLWLVVLYLLFLKVMKTLLFSVHNYFSYHCTCKMNIGISVYISSMSRFIFFIVKFVVVNKKKIRLLLPLKVFTATVLFPFTVWTFFNVNCLLLNESEARLIFYFLKIACAMCIFMKYLLWHIRGMLLCAA